MRYFLERIYSALFTDMTSTITTYVGKRKKHALYKGFVPLVEVATSSTKKRLAAVGSAGESCVGAKIPEARLVGQRDWVILFEDESQSETEKRLKLLEQKVMDLEVERDSHVLILGDLYISNVAGEALQFALGEQPRAGGLSSRFHVLARKNDPKLARHVKELNNHVLALPVTAASLACAFYSVIHSRNSEVHNQSVIDLLSKVSNAQKLLRRNPGLKQKFRPECLVLENFELIRTTFRF